MKKSVILAVMGLSVGAISSFGQGSIVFNSYNADGVGSGFTTTTFGANTSGYTGLVGSGTSAGVFDADVLYSLTPITDAAGNGALTAGWLTSGSGSPSVNSLVTAFGTGGNAGYFVPTHDFTLNPYTAGSTVYFEIIAFNGSSYANATIRGHSASFSDSLATGIVTPVNATWSSFTVAAVAPTPEPTTLALAGLGGLASLLALRRKQA